MPSSADPEITRVLEAAADAVAHAVAGNSRPIILIDGRSGAGKTTLAALVGERTGAPVLGLDALYPGWDGLARGAEDARRSVLEPLARGEQGVWRRWDWARGAPAEEHTVRADHGLVLEGAGVLTPASAALCDVSVWVDAHESSRQRRAMDRDGETYRPHWERWAAQEERHLREHDPISLATLVVTVP